MSDIVMPGPAPAVVNPLQWQVGHGVAPNGVQVCVLVLIQGALQTQVALGPDDTDKLGRALIDHASQARSGLIIPTGMPNGGKQS